MNNLLQQQKRNLFIDTDAGQFNGESEDVTKNLFKVCCAILNLKPKQRGLNPLEDMFLKRALDTIQDQRSLEGRQTLTIDQLVLIKNLVHRKAFSLSDRQIVMINQKFANFSVNRKNFLFSTKKSDTISRIK